LEVTLLPIHSGENRQVSLRLDLVTSVLANDLSDEKDKAIKDLLGYKGFDQGRLPHKPLYAVNVFRAAPQ
jgi:hypothetical protein